MHSGDAAAQIIKARPLTLSRARSEDLQHCQAYLQDCLDHESCNRLIKDLGQATSPTRLLQIESDFCLRLYTVPRGQYPAYAALSYCWGQAPQQELAKTVTTNIKDRFNTINVSQLPRTIRDALKVVRALKLSFIWIDALCIIQDDGRDVKMELSKMGGIYQGATITISAASSGSSVDGFLGDRDAALAYGKIFQLPYRYKQGDREMLGLALLCERKNQDWYEQPIDTRAWTMQEDILSVRLLRFGSEQTIWRCPSVHKAIDGGASPPPPSDLNGGYRFGDDLSAKTNLCKREIANAWRDWQFSVVCYTKRSLWNPGDRLVACAALAERFAATCGLSSTDYLAGLWKDDIAAQLLWERFPGSEPKRVPAPTWSWASINGPVRFHERYRFEEPEDDIVQARAQIDETKMMYNYKGYSYAEPGPACLWLNGALRQVHYDGSDVKQGIEFVYSLPLNICWDLQTDLYPDTLWCLEIMGSPTEEFKNVTIGLVLRRVHGVEFERVGCFDSEESSVREWYEGAERQTVCLV
jgi:hypothetical protein